MSHKKVLIIGAGISGMSAGCYLQMNGYDTEIFEMWKLPGGVCTARQRKGYTFDGCIHWLVGSSPASSFNKVWRELHAIQGREWIEFDEYRRVELKNGKIVTFYTDVAKLEAELLKIAPEDKKRINELGNTIRKLSKVDLFMDKPMELFNIVDYAKVGVTMFPFMKAMKEWGKLSLKEYIDGFANSDIREAFEKAFGIDENFPAAGIIMMLTVMNIRSAGYPIGGSLEFAKAIEKRYLELGGKINYNSRVEKILVENDKSVGIRLVNGSEFRSDVVISAADGHFTIFKALEGKYIDEEIKNHYENHPLFQRTLQVSLGIARDFSDQSHSFTFSLEKTIDTGNKTPIKDLTFRFYNFDPTMAPAGKTAAVALIPTEYEYWENLKSKNPEKYDSEKKRIADEIIDALEKKFGDIKEKIEVVDVATPTTYVDYTNNWKGSWEGWIPTKETIGKNLKKTLPGLDNFYMIGQWVDIGGGLPPAGAAGRNIARMLCRKDGKKFSSFES